MPAAHLRYPHVSDTASQPPNPLPRLLHTPFGTALVEIQGTVHFPTDSPTSSDSNFSAVISTTEVGRLEFPLYKPPHSHLDLHGKEGCEEGIWMKKVYMYVGKYQRLVGEVKRLPKALVMIAKSADQQADTGIAEGVDVEETSREPRPNTMLDVLDVIKYKIIFSGRPEPVGGD